MAYLIVMVHCDAFTREHSERFVWVLLRASGAHEGEELVSGV